MVARGVLPRASPDILRPANGPHSPKRSREKFLIKTNIIKIIIDYIIISNSLHVHIQFDDILFYKLEDIFLIF